MSARVIGFQCGRFTEMFGGFCEQAQLIGYFADANMRFYMAWIDGEDELEARHRFLQHAELVLYRCQIEADLEIAWRELGGFAKAIRRRFKLPLLNICGT